MGDEFKPRIVGALLECFIEFPLFGDDYSCLEKTVSSGRFLRSGVNG